MLDGLKGKRTYILVALIVVLSVLSLLAKWGVIPAYVPGDIETHINLILIALGMGTLRAAVASGPPASNNATESGEGNAKIGPVILVCLLAIPATSSGCADMFRTTEGKVALAETLLIDANNQVTDAAVNKTVSPKVLIVLSAGLDEAGAALDVVHEKLATGDKIDTKFWAEQALASVRSVLRRISRSKSSGVSLWKPSYSQPRSPSSSEFSFPESGTTLSTSLLPMRLDRLSAFWLSPSASAKAA